MPLQLKNFTVEKFNHDVNTSQDPAERFRLWSGYRGQVAGFIGRALAGGGPFGSAIVLGAGSLNDMDLPMLCDAFKKVVLSDIDIASARQGVILHNLSESQTQKVAFDRHDYSGAQRESFFPGIEKLAQRMAAADEFIDFLNRAFDALGPGISQEPQVFECVISCPVYTQLIYTQVEVFLKILHEYAHYPIEDLNRILAAVHHGMPKLLGRYNDWMLSLAKENGLLIVLTDVLEMDATDPILADVREHLRSNPQDDDYFGKMTEKNGLSLAMAGLSDLRTKVASRESFYALWPFNESKAYLVYGLAGSRRLRSYAPE